MFKKIALAAAFAALSSAAVAADQPYFYAGGDAGTTEVDAWDSAMSFGAFGGYQFNQTFGLEVGLRRLYDDDFGGTAFTVNQLSFSGTATLPLNHGFSLFGRLGFNQLSSEERFNSGYRDSYTETKILFGAGATYSFSPVITGRLELQKPASNVTNLSAGVAFRF